MSSVAAILAVGLDHVGWPSIKRTVMNSDRVVQVVQFTRSLRVDVLCAAGKSHSGRKVVLALFLPREFSPVCVRWRRGSFAKRKGGRKGGGGGGGGSETSLIDGGLSWNGNLVALLRAASGLCRRWEWIKFAMSAYIVGSGGG